VNKLSGKLIRAGSNLIIPSSSKNLTHYMSSDQRRQAIQDTPRNGSKIQYQVQKGDTLWSLSRKYNVSVDQLANWNSMAPRDSLLPGQRLVIWVQTVSAAPRDFVTAPALQTTQRVKYKVRKGDSLALIANKFRVTIDNLRKWNSLPEGRHLQPGQQLTLFVDVTRQS
jgi:membrane-bound lytic murein transglycosylase D